MKSLVIAEKPSVAGTLRASAGKMAAPLGDRYVVTWGLGHLVTLADPELR